MQIILQTYGKSVIEDMALLLAWRGSENRNVLVFCSMARSWSAEYCQRMWCWMIAGGGGAWNGAPTVLISTPHFRSTVILAQPIWELSKHAYGRQTLTPPTTKTKGKRLPPHKTSLASVSSVIQQVIETEDWGSVKGAANKKNGGILRFTYWQIKENVRNVWVEHQKRCVCVCV